MKTTGNEWLLGTASFAGVVRRTAIPGLDLLPANKDLAGWPQAAGAGGAGALLLAHREARAERLRVLLLVADEPQRELAARIEGQTADLDADVATAEGGLPVLDHRLALERAARGIFRMLQGPNVDLFQSEAGTPSEPFGPNLPTKWAFSGPLFPYFTEQHHPTTTTSRQPLPPPPPPPPPLPPAAQGLGF